MLCLEPGSSGDFHHPPCRPPSYPTRAPAPPPPSPANCPPCQPATASCPPTQCRTCLSTCLAVPTWVLGLLGYCARLHVGVRWSCPAALLPSSFLARKNNPLMACPALPALPACSHRACHKPHASATDRSAANLFLPIPSTPPLRPAQVLSASLIPHSSKLLTCRGVRQPQPAQQNTLSGCGLFSRFPAPSFMLLATRNLLHCFQASCPPTLLLDLAPS